MNKVVKAFANRKRLKVTFLFLCDPRVEMV
jgi:hypothetical protein